MACGGARDGVANYNGVEWFRPQYFSMKANGEGRMTELRLWGRQVKKDGTLGVRHLDYLWRWS